MEKIVREPRKIDLHIHSCHSKHKDGGKVSDNNYKNLNTLVDKLNAKDINICAITDHDVFSYEMYCSLKEFEGKGSIEKVLPGVEFSVHFPEMTGNGAPVHVIAIFDDSDENKVKNIEVVINSADSDDFLIPNYDLKNKYSEGKFIQIIREIDLDVILIAHQKSSPTGRSFTRNDLMTLKESSMNLLFTNYFDALEFRNRNNEIFNKSFIRDEGLVDKIDFITGTDCHSWEDYPFMYNGDAHLEENKHLEHMFTYAKCLPTFRGLSMCFTDYDRLSYEQNFFTRNRSSFVENLNLTFSGNNFKVPMSKGINAIIGDNSIGKSFLLFQMIDESFNTKLTASHRRGYAKYSVEQSFEIEDIIPEQDIFLFDFQGEIRQKFENQLFKNDIFLSSFFPEEVDTSAAKVILDEEFKKYLKALSDNTNVQKILSELKPISFNVEITGKNTFNITEFYENRKSKKQLYVNNIDYLNTVLATMQIENEYLFTEEENNFILNTQNKIQEMIEKYKLLRDSEDLKNRVFSIISHHIHEFTSELENIGTDYQREITNLDRDLSLLKENTIKLVYMNLNLKEYMPSIKQMDIKSNVNRSQYYNFVSSVEETKINNELFSRIISSTFNKGKESNPIYLTESMLDKLISRIPEGKTGLIHFKDKVNQGIDKALESKFIINPMDKDEDVEKVLSSGMNQRNYFEIISGEKRKQGIYIVDQPEDGVSQKAINEFVLKHFKVMSKNRQIIMVTHNPQFIVNLDVDNVIYLEKDEENRISVKSGALEYTNDTYSILDIISENIEGGIEAIRKRWNRYGNKY